MKEIDVKTWERREHFQFFSTMDYPHFNICFDLDITRFLTYVKEHNLSFYYAMIYAATASANRIEAFKYRIRDGKVILHDRLAPSFTDMSKGEELFKMVTVDLGTDLHAFVAAAQEKSQNQSEYFIREDYTGKDHYLYITSIPWISFTHISHTIRLDRNDSVPRVSWGKFFRRGEQVLLPFSVQVNHCLADGIHVGKYQDALVREMEKLCFSEQQ